LHRFRELSRGFIKAGLQCQNRSQLIVEFGPARLQFNGPPQFGGAFLLITANT
jgi:hypothetical protein